MFQETLYTIYKATNTVNNKIYIGFDSNWPTRLKQHSQVPFWKVPSARSVFHSAIRKHGFAAFTWDVLYQSWDREHCLLEAEEYFIREFRSHYLDGHGYNMTYGGQGNKGYKFTSEHRTKISTSQIGRIIPVESRLKMKVADRTKSSATWLLTSPEGQDFVVTNLAKWAREKGWLKQSLLRVHQGHRSHYKGWKVRQLSPQYPKKVYPSQGISCTPPGSYEQQPA